MVISTDTRPIPDEWKKSEMEGPEPATDSRKRKPPRPLPPVCDAAKNGDPDALRASFHGWHEEVGQLFAAVDRTFQWGLFRHAPLGRWSEGRVAVTGDAAHPTLPFLAQGAALALEDAVVLACALQSHELTSGLTAWEAARKPRATWLQAAAARTGKRFHSRWAPEQMVKATALGLFSKLLPDRAQGINDAVYAYDPGRAPL